MKKLLEMKDICKSFGSVEALKDVSLDLYGYRAGNMNVFQEENE